MHALSTTRSWLFFLLLMFLLLGCRKEARAKKLSGIYECNVKSRYWSMTTGIIDSVYTTDLTVEQNGKFVKILNKEIHIDSLWKNKLYKESTTHMAFEVQFSGKNAIYVYTRGTALGGGAETTYKGEKK